MLRAGGTSIMDQNYKGKMVILSSWGILKKQQTLGCKMIFFFIQKRTSTMDQNYKGKMVILSSQGILKKATKSGISNDFFFHSKKK